MVRIARRILGTSVLAVMCAAFVLALAPSAAAHASTLAPRAPEPALSHRAPAPATSCFWRVRYDTGQQKFSYGGLGGYISREILYADYDSSNRFCGDMYGFGEVFTPAGGVGDTLWVYLDDCGGDAIYAVSESVNKGYYGAWTSNQTSSWHESCGAAGLQDILNNYNTVRYAFTPNTNG